MSGENRRSYRELRTLSTFLERYRYLSLSGEVGVETFGWDRWMNQKFYKSREWFHARDAVLVRDNGCDLGIFDHPIHHNPLIHHINPLTVDDIKGSTELLLDPDNLVTVSLNTHNAIHYGSEKDLPAPFTERQPGDVLLW